MRTLGIALLIAALALLAGCGSAPPPQDNASLRDLQNRRLITARAERDALLRQQAERRRIVLREQWERIQRDGARRLAELQARDEAIQQARLESAQRRWRALQ